MRRKILQSILNFFFPAQCVSCGKFRSYLCQTCFGRIEFCEKQFCPVCGNPAFGGFTHPGCKTSQSLDGLLSATQYTGVMHSVISFFKYKPFLTDLQEVIRLILTSFLSSRQNYLAEKFLVAPVPLHWIRHNWRGYNQAETLGHIVAEVLGFEFAPKILKRTRFTVPQTQLKRRERLENLRGAFALQEDAKEKIKGVPLLLVDDVWTTGATMKECCKVLKRNGAKTVWALTLSRGIKKAKQKEG